VVVGENGAIFHKKKGVWKAEAEGFTQETLTTVVSIPNGNYQFSFYAAGNEGGIFRYY
jgi:hypothetical protein